jgi:hypothetical protein
MGRSDAMNPSGFCKAALLAAALGSACSAPSGPPALPGLSLGATAEAQTAFRPLLKRWASALTKDERAMLGPELTRFVEQFPGDGLGPAADALLGWIAVERGDLVAGRQLSRRAANLGAGSWQDFATLIDGAIRRRHGDAAAALKTLEPLISKLIDPWARDLLNEEVIATAILAHDARMAVKMMGVWLREATDEERALVRSRVERALAELGAADLVKIFDERAALRETSADGEIDPLLAQRLAAIAIATKDAVLAKKLLLTSGTLLGDRGDPVARLATGAAAIRVEARTVGLLLSFRTAETRRRSAEVAAGVVWGLELPGSGARLAVRDDAGDPGRIESALTELGRDGAAVVIAGVADEDARVAAKFAEDQHVPVILILRPADVAVAASGGGEIGSGAADSFVFSLGTSATGWGAVEDPRFGAWKTAHGALPTFWSAAGRDAAVRAREAVKELPQAATEDRTEVETRRRTVRTALGLANDGMWTSSGAGVKPPPNPER